MKLTNNEKERIREGLKQYVGRFPSQNKAAQSLSGTSSATLSSILQGKWESRTRCGVTLARRSACTPAAGTWWRRTLGKR